MAINWKQGSDVKVKSLPTQWKVLNYYVIITSPISQQNVELIGLIVI